MTLDLQLMETFERRLQQVLEMEEVSQAQFADKLGIQRGGLCHLLSGRNKPSFDFIVKLINSYPTVNPDWLLTGKGKPYKNDNSSEIAVQPEIDDLPPADDLFSRTAYLPQQPAGNQIDIPQYETRQPSEERTENQRTVEKVMIFFSDGTYEER